MEDLKRLYAKMETAQHTLDDIREYAADMSAALRTISNNLGEFIYAQDIAENQVGCTIDEECDGCDAECEFSYCCPGCSGCPGGLADGAEDECDEDDEDEDDFSVIEVTLETIGDVDSLISVLQDYAEMERKSAEESEAGTIAKKKVVLRKGKGAK